MNTGIYAIIPVKTLSHAKTRLSKTLTSKERRELNLIVLRHVVKTVKSSECVDRVVVVSPDPEVLSICRAQGAVGLEEERNQGVNAAVAKGVDYCISEGGSTSLVIPSDLPCITSSDLKKISGLAMEGEVVAITPSMRLDGTNMLLRKPPSAIKTSYDKDSFITHVSEASRLGVRLILYLSNTIMLDLDTEADLALFMEEPSNLEAYNYLSSVVGRGLVGYGGRQKFHRVKELSTVLEVRGTH